MTLSFPLFRPAGGSEDLPPACMHDGAMQRGPDTHHLTTSRHLQGTGIADRSISTREFNHRVDLKYL